MFMLSILSILFLFYRTIMDHSLQIALQKRKQQQWTHLEHQYSIYRKNYQGRPLLPKQVTTFLQFSGFITQLIPTFNHHYFQALTNDQSSFISQITSTIFNDLQAKLKNLAHRIQKKEIEQSNYKDVKTLCKVCLHQLRQAEIKEAKQSLQGREILAHNILKIIREVQQTSDTFSREEDQRFFDDLRAVLKKKEEVIELCQTQTAQFISMIDDQLRDLLLSKDQLLMRDERSSDEPMIKGYELKENVSKSLRTHLNEKIPEIINLVRASLQKLEDKQRKLRTATTAVQTADGESIRIMEMKRKISSLQADLQQANMERSQLSWSVQEKALTIQKYQQEHAQMREELNSKTYQLQKQIKGLEQKNRKLREEIDKQKSRRYLESSQNVLKSFNSIAQIKQTSVVEEPLDESVYIQVRKGKKKVTITSATKTGGKFYLPTLKKINVEDSQVTLLRQSSKHYFESQQQSFAEPQGSKAIVKDTYTQEKVVESAKASLSKVQSKASLKSVSRSGKKIERVMTLDNGKDTIKEREAQKKTGKVRTERATQGRQSLNESQTLPLVKQNKNKVSNFNKKKEVKKLNNSLNKGSERSPEKQYAIKEQQKKVEAVVMRQQAREVSQKLQEKAYERPNSLSSGASNKSTDINSNRIPRNSILKNHQKTTQESTATLPSKQTKALKSYLSNSFSKINQEIDKESYMTPLMAQEAASLKDLQRLQENNSIKSHLLQIYREISGGQQSQQLSLEKFSEYFTNYIQVIKQKNGLIENQNDKSSVEIHLPQYNHHNATSHILVSQQNRKQKIQDHHSHAKKLDLLKSKLLTQIIKHKPKETSLNTSYRPSLQYTADTARAPKDTIKQYTSINSANLLITLQTTLFFNQEIAFQYQTNFTRKKEKTTSMSSHIDLYLKDLFAVFECLKLQDQEYYHKISGFLRYPYSHSQNGFLQVDILKTLSFNTLTQFFIRIMTYHKRCNDKRNEGEKTICSHLLNFMKILQGRLTNTRGRVVNND